MRLKNVLRNSFFGIMGQMILILVGFFYQRTMNLRMGEDLVGINGVVSNVISLLSVTELGMSTAVVYHLYGALAANDEKKIASLMNLYRKAYYLFACVLSVLGLLCLPFIPMLMKGSSYSAGYIRIVFLLWLIRTALSYLLSYKRSILVADQKEYIVSIVTLSINALNYLACIVIIELWRNYILALTVNIFIELGLNLCLVKFINKKYPLLRQYAKTLPEKETSDRILGDVKNIFISRIALKLLVSTDNLIISGAIGTVIVGLYSNYCLITQSVLNVMLAVSGAIQPSVGNMFVEKNGEKNYQVLRQITFIFFLLSSFAAVCLYSLITPFVTNIWLGPEFQLSKGVLGCLTANTCAYIIVLPINLMMGVSGLFKRERSLTVVAAVVNLAVSLLLVRPLGLVGVLVGTFLAYCVQFGFRVRYFFAEYLQKSCLPYLKEMLQYMLLICLETFLIGRLTEYVYQGDNILQFFIIMCISMLLPNILNLALYCRSWRLRSIVELLKIFILNYQNHGK